eukprot:6458424-Pyramimonas_sp.AAC.1
MDTQWLLQGGRVCPPKTTTRRHAQTNDYYVHVGALTFQGSRPPKTPVHDSSAAPRWHQGRIKVRGRRRGHKQCWARP